jgi:membrane-bound lytic murein transglycosylase D
MLASSLAAHAQEDEDDGIAVPAPESSAEEAPSAEPPPSLQGNTEQRKAVRGTPLETNANDPLRRALREFERETFPASSSHGAPGQPGARPTSRRATPPSPPSWLRGAKLGDLPVRWDARVVRYLEFYKDDPRGRALMSTWLKAKGRYERMISEALRRHRLPQDLIYLCMIESSFDSNTYSRVGASGLWQFMPSGTVIYGLRMDYWVDERNDPVKATEAAMAYWKDLHERFGSWHLALAAYNAGFGAVLKSMAKYNTNDFWTLLELEGGLPWESSIYVPKALAAAVVGHNLSLFGYADLQPSAPFEYDVVKIDKSVLLTTIAKAAGVPTNAVLELNPQLRRNRTPPGGYELRIPKGTKEAFTRGFPQHRAESDGYDEVLVKHGERFEDIATTHGTTVKALRELNDVTEIIDVRGGTVLLVPRVDDATRKRNRAAAEVDLYRSEVAPGAPGDPMIVAVPDKDFSIPGRKRVFYRVVAGDTLEGVAAVFAVRPAELAAWNDLDPEAKIQARMVLVAYVDPAFDAEKARVALLDASRLMVVTMASPEHLDLFEGRKGRVRKKIVVKAGDTLESLGRPHHLTKYDMARINRRSYYTPLVAGEELVVYAVVDKAKARKAGVYDPPKRQLAKKKKRGGKVSASASAKAKIKKK